ncbi:MAG: helix-turn-helix domain-containing protein [Planctomycetes bacterium]|nr:helix-turn-helix domain-containing protein [Planctomycetota bacterium]
MQVTPNGEKIKRLRNERAWTQTQLARIAGKDVRTIQRVEASRHVSHDTLLGLAGALDVDVKDILRPDPPSVATEGASAEPAAGAAPAPMPPVELLPRITSGKELLAMVTGAHAFQCDHEDVEDRDAATEIGAFLQGVRDYCDIAGDLTIPQRVDAAFELTGAIERLAGLGYWVFGRTSRQRYIYTAAHEKQSIPLLVATVIVLSSRSPAVVTSSPIPHAPSTSARLRVLQGTGGT